MSSHGSFIILFYSNYCQHSKKLLILLQKAGWYNRIKLINIDEGKFKIPRAITSVPTMIIPNSNQPLIGEDVFKWVDQNILQRQKQQQPQQQRQQQSHKTTETKQGLSLSSVRGMDGIMFSNSELFGGFSDNYAPIVGDYSLQKSSQMATDKSFAFIGREKEYSIKSSDDKGNQFSGKKDDLMQRMERLKASRDAEIKNVPKRI